MAAKNKKILWLLLLLAAVLALCWVFKPVVLSKPNLSNKMKLSSPSFADNAEMPEVFTCRGDGRNPSLRMTEVPGDAVSLALIVDDPDAAGGDFVHWIAWDIKRDAGLIDEGLPPAGAIEGQNSIGQVGYIAPCPPSGTHHYYFKLYALDKNLELDETTTKDELMQAMTGHIIDEAQLVGLVSANNEQ